MAKLTAEEQATLDSLIARRDAADDDDDGAIWVRNADGHETRLTGKRADAWLARNGYSDAAGDASTPDAPLAPAGGKAGPKPAAGKAGGKQPAKPAARASSGATPPADDADQDADETPVDDADPPARTGRRAFF